MSGEAGRGAALVDFVFVSSNPGKVRETERILGAEIDSVAVDLPEIQSAELLAVLRAKGEEAWRRLRRPLVVEETGLELAALNGFPGPLVKWMLSAVGAEGIARLSEALGETGVAARCAVLYRHRSGVVIGEGATLGRLVMPPRGDRGFGWDPVFEPVDSDKTYGELDDEVKDRIGHRGRAWRDLLAKLR